MTKKYIWRVSIESGWTGMIHSEYYFDKKPTKKILTDMLIEENLTEQFSIDDISIDKVELICLK